MIAFASHELEYVENAHTKIGEGEGGDERKTMPSDYSR